MKNRITKLLLILAALVLTGVTKVSAQNAYYVINTNTDVMTFYYDILQSTHTWANGEIVRALDVNSTNPAWFYEETVYPYAMHVRQVVFDQAFSAVRPTNTHNWFHNMVLLTTVTGIANLNTSEVTDMSGMFSGCERLNQSLDLRTWNVAKVTDMSSMFEDCKVLPSLNLSNWNTAKVTNMSNMFEGCKALTILNLTNWNTAKVTTMEDMFNDCESLTSLDLSSFNTANVGNMNHIFTSCNSLVSLNVSSFNTSKLTDMSYMFYNLNALQSLDLSSFNTSKVTDMHNMFFNCYSLKSIKFGSGWTNNVLTNTNSMFKGCSTLSSLSNFIYFRATSNLTNMGSMFEGCSSLRNIPFNSSIDTRNVTNMTSMFKDCSSLLTLNMSRWNVANVTNMEYMFSGCSALTAITGITDWNTSSVTDMRYMFERCSSFTNLDLSGWNTSNVTITWLMFSECSSLVTLDLTGWDTANNTYMTGMFADCSNLTTIYAGPGWSTRGLTGYGDGSIFKNCSSLVGGNGTVWEPWDYGTSRARIDRPDSPGYLTAKVISYGLRVGGIEVTNWNASEITGSTITGTVSFDADTHTLTLDGATVTNNSSYGGIFTSNNYAFSDLTVNLVGTNTLNVTGGYYPVSLRYNTTITGTGSLSGVNGRVYNGKRLTIGGSCTITGANLYGDTNVETLVVKGNGTTVQLTDYLSGFASVTLQNGLVFTTPAGGSYDTTNHYVADAAGNKARGIKISNQAAVYGLKVAGINVTSSNASSITGTGISGSVRFDASTRTLTLTNATISCSGTIGISTSGYVFDDLTIKLVGSNSIDAGSSVDVMLYTNSSITGTGTLNTDNIKISGTNQLTICGGCTVNATYVQGVSNAGTLVLRNAQTKLVLTDNITNLASVTMYDGLHISTPTNGSYDTTYHYVVNVNGNRATGVTIDNNTDYNYGLSVIGTAVKVSNCSNVLGNGTVSYNPDTRTLTLTNATLVSSTASGIHVTDDYIYDDITIKLVGDNTFNISGYRPMALRCNTTITGTGSLTLQNYGEISIQDWEKELVIEGGCTINAHAIGGNLGRQTLTVRGAETQINLSFGFFYFDSVTLEDGLYYEQPAGGSYSTSIHYMVDRDGNKWTDGVIVRKAQPYVVFDSDDNSLTFYNDKQIASHCGEAETVYYLNTSDSDPGWYAKRTNVTNVVFDISFDNVLPTSTYRWFYGMKSLTNIAGIEYLHTDNVTTMKEMFYNCNALEALDVSNFNTANVTNMAYLFYGCKLLTELNVAGFNTGKVTDMNYMFRDCNALQSLDVSGFNTENVESMSYMFYGCNLLTELDVAGFDTENVTDMSGMFGNIINIGMLLEHLDVSGFNTANVTNMTAMFSGCKVLQNLDVSGFNTDNVTSMASMFSGCKLLTELDVAGFETGNVTSMSNMFYNCQALTNLDVSNFNTSSVTTMQNMFSYCYGLTSLDLSNFNTGNVTTMANMFESCSSLTSLDVSSFNTANVTTLYYTFEGCSGLKELDLSSFETSNVKSFIYTFNGCSNLETIYAGNWSHASSYSDANMFDGCTKIKGGKGTTYVSQPSGAFMYAHIDGGTGNAGYFTDVSCRAPYAVFSSDGKTMTFYDDKQMAAHSGGAETVYYLNEGENAPEWKNDGSNAAVTTVVFHESFASARPSTMAHWFNGMSNLTTITNIENLNTSMVTSMRSMFWNCSRLTSVDLSSLNTQKVNSMSRMFYSCTSLTNVNLGNIDTQNVTDMSMMFDNCSSLTSVDLSNINTQNVTDMNYMFAYCSNLTNVNLSNFNTSNVTDMSFMFFKCTALTNVDLSNFNTQKVTDMSHMFSSCSNLRTIYVGDDWNTNAVTSSENMFSGCTNLRGSKGTAFDINHTSKAYAHIDGGISNPGYLWKIGDFLLGDVNGDGEVNSGDVMAIYSVMAGNGTPEMQARADVNGDGNVDSGDIMAIYNIMAGN
jgi:surface protein